MKLSDYFRSMSLDDRIAFAGKCGKSLGYLKQVACGYRSCPAGLSVVIERASDGYVSRKELRPSDWQDIWPELAASPPE